MHLWQTIPSKITPFLSRTGSTLIIAPPHEKHLVEEGACETFAQSIMK